MKPSVDRLPLKTSTEYRVQCFDKYGRLKWEDGFKNRVVTAGLDKLLDATFVSGLASPAWFVGLVGGNITDGAITSGANTFTSATNPFTAADVGAEIIIRGAGAAGADLITSISAFGAAGSVTVADNAATTVSGAGATWGARPLDTMPSHGSWSETVPYSNAARPNFTPGAISGGAVNNAASKATFTINATAQVFGAFLADSNAKSGATGVLYGMGVFTGGSRQVQNTDTFTVQTNLSATAA